MLSLLGPACSPGHYARPLEVDDAGEDEERVHEIGITHTADQALDLLNHGVPGIHFYVLNRYFHIAEIMERIRPTIAQSAGKASL